MVVWQTKHFHGTTLSAKGPATENDNFRQSGMSIVTPVRLPGIWERYLANELTAMEAEEELEQEDLESDEDMASGEEY